MRSYQTVSRDYFDAVIRSMREQGFQFMAWVTMNSNKFRYHVDSFRYAQESRLFFVASGKAFIVMLKFTEQFGYRPPEQKAWDEGFHCVYWSGRVDYSYDSLPLIEEYVREGRRLGGHDEEERDFNRYMAQLHRGVESCLESNGFRVGWSYSEDEGTDVQKCLSFEQVDVNSDVPVDVNSDVPLDPQELAKIFGAMLNLLRPHLYRLFENLQVTDYAPHYTFPGQEKEFWAKFPLHRLKAVAPRIWGSEFS